MVYVTVGCPNAAVTNREACSKVAAAFLASGREAWGVLGKCTCRAPEHPRWRYVGSCLSCRQGGEGTGDALTLPWVKFISVTSCGSEACKLHAGVTVPKVTVPKQNVPAVLEERTFIPAFFVLFCLTRCLNVHRWYCGSESPATLAPTPSITAVALLPALCSSWFFPTAAARPFACRLPAAGQEERAFACPGRARLRGQGTAGQEKECC